MVNWFMGARALVFLRRISRELSRANDLYALRLSIEHPEQYKRRVVHKQQGATKLGEIGTASIEKWNENWEKTHPQYREDIGSDSSYIP